MMTGAMCFSLLPFRRCRLHPLPHIRSTFVGCMSCNIYIPTHASGVCSKFKLLGSHGFEPFQGAINKTLGLRACSTVSGLRTRDVEKSEPKNFRHEFLNREGESGTLSSSVSRCFSTIQYNDAKYQNSEIQDPKQLVRLFVFDMETTGFCKENGRIIEIAVRDLLGGKNCCLHTLINPEQEVPNSDIHGITTQMVNRPDVPRMKDFIPILLRYIRSRPRITGSVSLFIAHNARNFDVPYLVKEFSRCSMDIPTDWLFLDTLPLGRQLMKSNGLRQFSLKALGEHFNIQARGETHRAMSDVDLLAAILERLTFEMKLTVVDFLENSFKAPLSIDLIKAKRKR